HRPGSNQQYQAVDARLLAAAPADAQMPILLRCHLSV
ncbi:hypothetical protein Lpp229_03259, partial [Lacticaseibacillus paracasei subsp. paracasei Lpp229]